MNVKNLTTDALLAKMCDGVGKVKRQERGKLNEVLTELFYRAESLEKSLKRTEKELERKQKDLIALEAKVKAEALKRKIKDYFTEGESKALVRRLKKMAKTDKKIAMFLAEQVFGKARGTVGIDGGAEDKPIMTMAAVLDGLEKPIRMEPLPAVPLIDSEDSEFNQ